MTLFEVGPFLNQMYEEIWEENLWELWVNDPWKEESFAVFYKKAKTERDNQRTNEDKIAEAKAAEAKIMADFRKLGGEING